MNWTSIVAIYALFWVLTHDELGLEKTPGQADSAPGNFNPKQILLRTTLLSAALFGLYYANYAYGWVNRHSFDFLITGPA